MSRYEYTDSNKKHAYESCEPIVFWVKPGEFTSGERENIVGAIKSEIRKSLDFNRKSLRIVSDKYEPIVEKIVTDVEENEASSIPEDIKHVYNEYDPIVFWVGSGTYGPDQSDLSEDVSYRTVLKENVRRSIDISSDFAKIATSSEPDVVEVITEFD